MKSHNYQLNLITSQSTLIGRFLISLAVSFLILLAAAIVFINYVIPGLIPSDSHIQVLSSPSQVQLASPAPTKQSLIPRPLPRPPVQRTI